MRCYIPLFLVATFIAMCLSLTIPGVPGIKYLIEVDNTKTKSIVYFTNTSRLPFRVNVWTDDKYDNPNDSVLVVISQTTKVTSWQLPYVLPTSNGSVVAKYTNISKILCYDKDERNLGADFKNDTRNFTVSLSTRTSKTINVSVYVDMFENFFIQGNQKYEAQVSPSRPMYYSYSYPKNFTAETVALKVHSEGEACLVVSLQQKICPVEDLNFELAPGGMFQTVRTKGGLNIWKYLFPNGFYLVFNVKTDNQTCNSKKVSIEDALFPSKHSINISFEINDGRTKNQYILSITAIILIHVIVIGFLTYFCTCYGKGTNPPRNFVEENQEHKWKYFCYTFTAFGFYIMPVIQLIYFNQKNIDASGNLDKCYYNYYCSNPLYVDDFNHIFSNVGYLFFGGLTLVVVWKDSRNTRNVLNCGRQRHYALYFAMGLALIFEGIMSSTYHVCPNQSDFQFDTCFMYVMIMLVIGKLFQNRYSDRMEEASYVLFSLLATIVIFVSLETMASCDSYVCHVIKYIIITIFNLLHVGLLVFFGYKSYYKGALCGRANEWQALLQINVENAKCKREQWRFVLVECLIVSFFFIKVYLSGDFATNVLMILIIHASTYCIYCIRMEICRGEKICKTAIYLGVISAILWVCASYFFSNKAADSKLTPAESRELNTECYTILFKFYDTHDVWHLLSALALFLTFKFLLVLDDDLVRKAEKRKTDEMGVSQALINTVDSVNESYNEI